MYYKEKGTFPPSLLTKKAVIPPDCLFIYPHDGDFISVILSGMLHVVLYRPEIPQNTGSIARQCVGMNSSLHVVKPIGFDMSNRTVKRAGLDYWDELTLSVHENSEEFLKWLGDRKPWLITSRGRLRYDTPGYQENDILVFGNETGGLPGHWLEQWSDRTVYVPILGNVRNYNLSNTVSIVLAHASLRAGMYESKQ